MEAILDKSGKPISCSVSDCDYSAYSGGKCYAHSLGKNPVMSLEEYYRVNG